MTKRVSENRRRENITFELPRENAARLRAAAAHWNVTVEQLSQALVIHVLNRGHIGTALRGFSFNPNAKNLRKPEAALGPEV